MSKVGVIVALLIAVLLAAAALFLTGKPPKAAQSGPLLDFEPAKATEVRIARPDGGYDAIRRGRNPGDWSVILAPQGQESAPWPAAAAQVRAVLRILSTLTPDQPAEAGITIEDPRTVTVSLEGGEKRELQISPRALAGRVVARSGDRAGLVGADVGQMLAAGPREWRDPSALPGIGPDIARITLKGTNGTVALGRVQGRWGVREPVAEPADRDAISKLLAALQGVRITNFLDDGPPGQTGLEQPVAQLTIESDSRDGEGAIQTTRTSLAAGQAAELGAKTVFAHLERSDGTADPYSRTVIASGEELARISTDPAAYLSRSSVHAPAADIAGLRITAAERTRTFQRSLDGWRVAQPGSDAVPAAKADQDAITAALTLLTTTPAEAVGVSDEWPKQWGDAPRPIATIEALGPAGESIAATEALLAPSTPPQFVIRSGRVWRRYAAEAGKPVAAWLARD